MKVVVADASVILKWALQKESENGFAIAYKLLEDFINEKIEIHVPEIWKYEVGNILAIKEPEYAISLMEVLMDYSFLEHSLGKGDCKQIIALQNKIGQCTFYDVAYHYVALKMKGTLITADKKYFQQSKEQDHIKLLTTSKNKDNKVNKKVSPVVTNRNHK